MRARARCASSQVVEKVLFGVCCGYTSHRIVSWAVKPAIEPARIHVVHTLGSMTEVNSRGALWPAYPV